MSKLRMGIYGVLAVAGAVIPWYFNIRFMIESDGAFNLMAFIRDGYVNSAAASLTSDVAIAAAVFLVWLPFEARRLMMRRWWVYALLTPGIAFSCAFPLFLCMRERRLQQIKAQQTQ